MNHIAHAEPGNIHVDVRGHVQRQAFNLKLAELERAGKLSAVVTQNIDGLHSDAGSKNTTNKFKSMRANEPDIAIKIS